MAGSLVAEQVAVRECHGPDPGQGQRADRPPLRLPAMAVIVRRRLSRVLRGWGAYFRYGNSSQRFDALDSYVNMRLARLASVKHGRNGRGWTTRVDYEWVNRLGTYR